MLCKNYALSRQQAKIRWLERSRVTTKVPIVTDECTTLIRSEFLGCLPGPPKSVTIYIQTRLSTVIVSRGDLEPWTREGVIRLNKDT